MDGVGRVGGFLRGSPARPWILLFVFANLVLPQDGGGNPRSRFATLAMLGEHGSLRVDETLYSARPWSWDWARGPDGHLYSNKPPGPTLLAFPLYRSLDAIVLQGVRGTPARLNARLDHEWIYDTALSFALQVLPFALIVAWAARWLKSRGASSSAIQLAVVGALFGNTAAVFMNTFFGHGMAATFLLAALVSLVTRRYFLVGLFYGGALLSEYAAAVILVPLVLAIFVQARGSRRPWLAFLAGGVLPGLLWSVYHAICFGSPFRTALEFSNPIFTPERGATRLPLSGAEWPRVVGELLFGPSRGLLVTQPWILLLLVSAPFLLRRRKEPGDPAVAIAIVVVPSLAALIAMCALYPAGWHGGWCSGPRYLSVILPGFALLAGILFDGLPRGLRNVLVAALAVSVLLYVLILSTTILAPDGKALWPYLVGRLFAPEADAARARFGIVGLLFLFASLRAVREPTRGESAEAAA